MVYDTTIPGTTAEITTRGPATPIGSAGVIAIVGRFEKGDVDTPYYITNPNDGLRRMGTDPDYPGTRIIEQVFKKDAENNNYGASSVIAINAGIREGASCTLVDTTAEPVNVMTLILPGGVWGNSLTATVASGTLGGKKLTIKKGSTVIETFDNCADATALYNKIISGSILDIQVKAHDLTKTLKDVADSPFTGGTETADPTTSDLNYALDILMDEDFDILIFTDVPEDTYYASIEAYLNERIQNDKFTRATLPIDSTKTVEQAKTIAAGVDTGLIDFTFQPLIIGAEELTDAESAARLAGATAGLPVNESLTNKIISDINGLGKWFTADVIYDLTAAGIMVLELKNRKNNDYGVVSAVTASHTIGDDGKKTAWSEQHAVRALCYICNQLNMKPWLGRTGISRTKSAVKGEVNNRVKKMLDDDIAEDIEVTTVFDDVDEELLYIDVAVKALGMIKHIHKRVSMQE